MPGLGDTVFDLAQMRRAMERASAGGGGLARLTPVQLLGNNPGALRMFAYVPPGLPPGAPLVVVLHGCTQTASGYDHGSGWSKLAARHGFALLFPEQTSDNNANLCFNWFQPDDVTRDRGEVRSIRQMIGEMVESHALNPARIYVSGLSAGGAMAAALLATCPELFAGGAIIAGLPYGAASGLQAAFEAMHHVRVRSRREWGDLVRAASPPRASWPAVQIWHGSADATVRQGNYDELLKQWADVHAVLEPPLAERNGSILHQSWRGPTGAVVLEGFLIDGLAHGTPLWPGADDLDQAAGAVGPHMVDAGISSTWQIARSWGLLTQPAQPRPADRARPDASGATLVEKVLKAVGLSD